MRRTVGELVMGIDKAAVAHRFNRSAETYDSNCWVQRGMATRLMSRLHGSAIEPNRILELGCGTGHLTEQLVRSFPDAQVVAVDFAERMVEIARRRVGRKRVQFDVVDAERTDFEPLYYDLIVSNATIQWFDHPGSTLATLTAALRPGAWMLHTTFGPDTFRELRCVFRRLANERGIDAGRVGIDLRSAGEWALLLSQVGLHEVGYDRSLEVVRYPSADAFICELQATGATYHPNAKASGPSRLRFLVDALARYDDELGTQEGVPVTYELVELAGSYRG